MRYLLDDIRYPTICVYIHVYVWIAGDCWTELDVPSSHHEYYYMDNPIRCHILNVIYYTTYEIPCESPCYAEYYNIAVCPIGCLTWNLIYVSDYPLRHVTMHIYIYI